jgi:hypothetical protein
MAYLTRDEILSGRSLKREEVTVPELGGEVFVYELSPKQRMEFFKWVEDHRPDTEEADVWAIADFGQQLLVRTLRGPDMQLLFKPEDSDLLGEMLSDPVTERLSDVARNLSGLGDDAIEQKADQLPNSPDA